MEKRMGIESTCPKCGQKIIVTVNEEQAKTLYKELEGMYN